MTYEQHADLEQIDQWIVELHELEVDTFEIEDMADTEHHALLSACSSNSLSSCVSCGNKLD